MVNIALLIGLLIAVALTDSNLIRFLLRYIGIL